MIYANPFLVISVFPFLICVVEDYNDNVPEVYKIPSMGRESTLAILVGGLLWNRYLILGNSRNVWVPFISALASDDDLFKKENPLDEYKRFMYFICRYTKKAVESVLSKIQIRHKEYYTSNGQRLPFLNYQLIAEVLYFKLNEV